MRKSNELQIGKAGEYLACADLIMKGLIAYLSEQGLPYDILIDTGKRLLRCQVKTTEYPRPVPQRNKQSFAYRFNVKRHGKGNKSRYGDGEVDVFALVELEHRTVVYVVTKDMPETINIRVDSMRGQYYDEKGASQYQQIQKIKQEGIKTRKQAAKDLCVNLSTLNRMWSEDYKPYQTNARYWSDFKREKEWFDEI
jgi:hypothetical protein